MADKFTQDDLIKLSLVTQTAGEVILSNLVRITNSSVPTLSPGKLIADHRALSQISDDLIRLAYTTDQIATSLETSETPI